MNGVQHETREVGYKLVVYTAVGLALSTTAVFLLVWGLFYYLKVRDQPKVEYPQVIPPAPRLRVDPTVDIRDLRTREDHILSSYSWVDQSKGVVRIPIDRAIDIVAQRGLPYRDYQNTTGASAHGH